MTPASLNEEPSGVLERLTEKLLSDVPERPMWKLPIVVNAEIHRKSVCRNAATVHWRIRTSRHPTIFWQACTTGTRKRSLLEPGISHAISF